jgi:prepilin-type N-terminal cleavage/methylation domain-containing protein
VRALTRRGLTLVEILVALTLLGMLGAVAAGWLDRLRTAYRAESLTADRGQNLRAAAAILPAELREIDAADGDLVAMGPTAITVRAPRQLGVLCGPPLPLAAPGMVVLPLYDAPRYGLRDFRPSTDSLWVLAEDDSLAGPRPTWLLGAVVDVAPGPCPDGGPGSQLTATLAPPTSPSGVARVLAGAPVLGFEPVTYRLYRSAADALWYIGQQTTGTIQPMIGPVTPDGLAFTYYATDGSVTAQPRLVSLIEIRVRAPTAAPLRGSTGALVAPIDSVVTVVALRNNPR